MHRSETVTWACLNPVIPQLRGTGSEMRVGPLVTLQQQAPEDARHAKQHELEEGKNKILHHQLVLEKSGFI